MGVWRLSNLIKDFVGQKHFIFSSMKDWFNIFWVVKRPLFFGRGQKILHKICFTNMLRRCRAAIGRYMFCENYPGAAASTIRMEDSIGIGLPFNSTRALSQNQCGHINLTTPQQTLVNHMMKESEATGFELVSWLLQVL